MRRAKKRLKKQRAPALCFCYNNSSMFPGKLPSIIIFASAAFFISAEPLRAQTKDPGMPNIPLAFEEDFDTTLEPEVYVEWIGFSFALEPAADKPSTLANPNFCAHALCSLETSRRNAFSKDIRREIHIHSEPLQSYLENLQETSRIDPENARFEFDEESGRVRAFSPGRDGAEIALEAARENLTKTLLSIAANPQETEAAALTLPSHIIPAKTHSEDAEAFGVTSLLGEGQSNFSGSSSDRIFNIRFASDKFHGTLIAPEEEFSFVDILGEVDEAHGWRPELVIRNNRTEPEYGGGICQVSTTLFRAAVHAGLRITMRQNHSYPVKYYQPIGFDASVYVPMPDLRFVNNTPNHLLVQREIDGNKLLFRLYGTDDGRRVTVTEPEVLERGEDGSMKTVFTQTVTNSGGETLIDKSFYSNYDNPKNYPKPEDIDLSEKPKDWSKRQWEEYKKEIQAYLENR